MSRTNFFKINGPLTLKQLTLTTLFFLLPFIVSIFMGFCSGLIVLIVSISLELTAFLLVRSCRKYFPWLITSEDLYPKIDPKVLDKFMEFGFDPEIGWERKPFTSKSEVGKNGEKSSFHINETGGRANPQHETLPEGAIAIYGDSFGFSRQVNDDESLQWHLSEMMQVNVLNFAVGNYGLDQALLRFRRLRMQFPTKITVFGVVPSTIVRIHDLWKHYNEFGNIYGFKPRFALDKHGKLLFIPNQIISKEAFLRYEDFLPIIQKKDLFYRRKFLNEMLRFPYLAHICAQPRRNYPLLSLVTRERLKRYEVQDRTRPYPLPMQTIMRVNLELRESMFFEEPPCALLKKLTLLTASECYDHDSKPLLLWMPQKDDLLHVRKCGKCYYGEFISWAKEHIPVVDMTPVLLSHDDIDALYCDDTNYGGHFTSIANRLTAKTVDEYIKHKMFTPTL